VTFFLKPSLNKKRCILYDSLVRKCDIDFHLSYLSIIFELCSLKQANSTLHLISVFTKFIKMTRIIAILFLITVCSSCIKNETVFETTHVNQVVDGNEPPPFSGVTTVELKNYVNKLYTDLYGREPFADELDAGVNTLSQNDLTEENMTIFVKSLMDSDEYYDRFFEIYRNAYLGFRGPLQFFQQRINTFSVLLDNAIQNNNTIEIARLELEIDKKEKVLTLSSDYKNNNISINEAMFRIAYNSVYDQVNNGATNIVLSCYENFLKRFPNDAELSAGVNMNNGIPSVVLFQDGSSKVDFINIVVNSTSFYEGLIIDIFQLGFSRNPNSDELSINTILMTQGSTYQEIQIRVLISDEYSGF